MAEEVKPQSKPEPQTSLGAAIALVLCALCIMAFPKLVTMPGWLSLIFSIVGFLILLLGIIGTCMELFKQS